MKEQKWFLSRIKKMQECLKKENIDNVVLKDEKSLYYFLGFRIESNFHLILHSDALNNNGSNDLGVLIVPALEYEKAKRELLDFPISVINYRNVSEFNDIMGKIQKFYGIPTGKKGLMFDQLTLNEYRDVHTKIFNILKATIENPEEKKNTNVYSGLDTNEIVDITPIIDDMRKIKDPDELEKIEKAAQISDVAIEKGINSLKDGIRESEISAIIEYEMAKMGAEDRSFASIVASGRNSWFPHAGVTDKAIKDGEIVTIDIGALYKGYHSDITRTVLVGKGPYEKKLVDIINVVNESQKAALNVLKPGIRCNDVDSAARDYLDEKGYGKYFIHGLGHGVGLDVHDKIPVLNQQTAYELEEGMVVTVEPGVYIPEIGGTRTEDLCLITADGYRKLSKAKIRYY